MNSYPINLLLEKRKCLIVGGGKVAARKLKQLLQTGADIKVVGKKISDKIKKTAESNAFELHERSFKNSDLDNIFLIYITTDDRKLNLNILKEAEERGILSCLVDRNWRNGSFITPASIKHKEVSVAVSTQGINCRKSRLIKENLARHIDSIEKSELLIIGTDHNHMSLEERENIQLNGSKLKNIAEMVGNLWGIHEFMLINTCNRTELVAFASPSESLTEILKIFLKFDKLSEGKYYIKTKYEAFCHLCLTSAGLLSQTPGENHISAQLKEAFSLAETQGWGGKLLESLKNYVLHVSRQIRLENKSVFKSFETEELVFEMLKEKFQDISDKKIIIAGTGTVGSSIKNILSGKACTIDWLYFSKKPDSSDVSVSKLSLLPEKLEDADIVISTLNTDKAVITKEMSPCFKAGAEVIDIGMPRNVDSCLKEMRKDVNFSTMEDIKHWYRKKHDTIKDLFSKADDIIEKNKDKYEKISNSFVSRDQEQ